MTLRAKICIVWAIVITAFVCSSLFGSWLIGLVALALSRILIPTYRTEALIFWTGLLLPTVWFWILFAFSDHLPSAPTAFHSLWAGITYFLCLGPIVSIITVAVADCGRVGGSRDAS